VRVPGERAVELVSGLRALSPRTTIIIFSMFDEPSVVKELLAVGASAYLLKSVTRDGLIFAVREVCAGNRLLVAISRRSFEMVMGSRPAVLSDREIEILELVAQAFSNLQIARRLQIAEGTVKRHLRNVFAKLSAASRLDAVNKAVAMNLVSDSGSRPGARRG
jgi:DNA-binding NarL/FixJ family response regulator